ncbi:MAG TPA: RDD family protein [Thermoanaerobaculia bacterium]|nr:RDD family protein [Thermoanaerobaculia bacterium]
MSAISLDKTLEKARIHPVLTPEGLSLPFVVGSAGDRIGAFVLDTVLIVLATLGVWLLAEVSKQLGLGELGVSFALLVGFLLWNFYFIYFEAHRGGVTFGKRKTELRVISRGGGPLTAEAVVARNLMRNLEFYLPAMVFLAPDGMLPEAPTWGRLIAAVWFMVFALMPLFNKDRLRCGDLVAGTIVVKAPAAVLLADLTERGMPPRPAERPAARWSPPPPTPAFAPEPVAEEFPFTRQQLDIYGIHELQVLEDLLRRDDQGVLDGRILEEVCDKIKTKIGWPRERWNVQPRRFLDAFYRAQRARLEQKMLFGQRQERKKG